MAHQDRAPRLFVLAGTNGAGKSSIGGAMIRTSGANYFNPDEAASAIRQARPYLGATQANSAAWHEGKRLLQHAIAHRLDYNFETTLGGRSFARMLREAAGEGFEVRVWYVGLGSPEQHLARIKARVSKGGHDIPEADVRRRFDHSRLQLIELMPHLAELRVYDNSAEADPHQGVAPRPRLILHWQRALPRSGTVAGHQAQAPGQVLVPADAAALAATPPWAKSLVMAAMRLAAPAPAGPSAGSAPVHDQAESSAPGEAGTAQDEGGRQAPGRKRGKVKPNEAAAPRA